MSYKVKVTSAASYPCTCTLEGTPSADWAVKAVQMKTLGAECTLVKTDSEGRKLVRTASGQEFTCELEATHLTHDQEVRIPELKSFTRQRVFSLWAYLDQKQTGPTSGRTVKEEVAYQKAKFGCAEYEFSAQAMVLDGRKPTEVMQLALGEVVEIEGFHFVVQKPRPMGGSNAHLELIG